MNNIMYSNNGHSFSFNGHLIGGEQQTPAPVITEVWVYIDRVNGDGGNIIQVYTLKVNNVGIEPTIVEGKQAQSQTWYDDTAYAYQFNYDGNCYSPQRYDTDAIKIKLPTIPSDNDVISYGPYNPYWYYNTDCNVYLVGIDINGIEYFIANSSYNQQTYFNNNKQRVQLTYISPV